MEGEQRKLMWAVSQMIFRSISQVTMEQWNMKSE